MKVLAGLLNLILLAGFMLTQAWALEPSLDLPNQKPKKDPTFSAEQEELMITKGIIHLNAKEYAQAEEYFWKVYGKNPKSFQALESLAQLEEGQNHLPAALEFYQRAHKLANAERRGFLNFKIGELQLKLNAHAKAELAFRQALANDSFAAQALFYLAYNAYKQNLFIEAESFLQSFFLAEQTLVEPAMHGYAHLLMAEVQLRLGYTRYGLAHLNKIDLNENPTLKPGVDDIQRAVDQRSLRLSAGILAQYDSNITGLSNEFSSVLGLKSKNALGSLLMVQFQAQNSPLKKISYLGEYGIYVNQHYRNDLYVYDTLSNNPAVGIGWWNEKNLELKLRYQLLHTFLDRNSFKPYYWFHGPTLLANYFFWDHYETSLSYQFKLNSYQSDSTTTAANDKRGGTESLLTWRAGFNSASPVYQPYVQVSLNPNNAEGKNYVQNTTSFELGSGWWFSDSIRANLAANYSMVSYPENSTPRDDKTIQLKSFILVPISANFSLMFDLSFTHNTSTLSTIYNYDRFLLNSGLLYAMAF